MIVLAGIPSPSRGEIHLGPFPLRGYALMIILGIIVSVIVADRRLRARGEDPGLAADLATWGVPFGIVGARIYSVITTPSPYFGAHGQPLQALEIWKGGLGIWGAIAGGALGVWIACKRRGVSIGLVADACAPALALAQGIGRWGNWFNQELYGRPTNLPWAVEIDPGKQLIPGVSHYQPTFLYESLWDIVVVAGILVLVDRRHRLGRGKLFALYVAVYTVGRGWIEALRIDDAEHIFGVRLNDWVALIVFLGAVAALVFTHRPVDPPLPEGSLSAARDGKAAEPEEPAADAPAVDTPAADAPAVRNDLDVGVVKTDRS